MYTKTQVCKVPCRVGTFAEALKTIRGMLGITQGKLAAYLGVHVYSIKRYESNKRNASAKILPKIWLLLNKKIQAIAKSPGMDRIPTDLFSPEAMEQYEACPEIAEQLDKKLCALNVLPTSKSTVKRRVVVLKKMIENQLCFLGLLQRIKAQITKGY